MNLLGYMLQMPNLDQVAQLFSMIFGVLNALGVLTILGLVITAILIINVTFWVIHNIGGGRG